MQYKFYRYTLENEGHRPIVTDRHVDMFNRSIGRDIDGTFSRYRGKNDAVLMFVRPYDKDFSGLIGRHSTEREVTTYDELNDEASSALVGDDDYPNAPFICMPRLGMIACVDGGKINADSALSRLHQILAHRQRAYFVFQAMREPVDLRKAVKRFRLVEVSFEILPVNPHTGDLGLALDKSRKLDHIRKISGKAVGTPSDPIALEGGFLSAVQELQQSGHSKVGFVGLTQENVQVSVPKPKHARALSDGGDEEVFGESIDLKVSLPGDNIRYPFEPRHVQLIRRIAAALKEIQLD